jgi:cell wall-associated NlpC family hydrolase
MTVQEAARAAVGAPYAWLPSGSGRHYFDCNKLVDHILKGDR